MVDVHTKQHLCQPFWYHEKTVKPPTYTLTFKLCIKRIMNNDITICPFKKYCNLMKPLQKGNYLLGTIILRCDSVSDYHSSGINNRPQNCFTSLSQEPSPQWNWFFFVDCCLHSPATQKIYLGKLFFIFLIFVCCLWWQNYLQLKFSMLSLLSVSHHLHHLLSVLVLTWIIFVHHL